MPILFPCIYKYIRHAWELDFQYQVLPYCIFQLLGAVLGGWLNLVVYGGSIATFEGKKGIIHESAAGIVSAKCFGEYFL